MAVAMPTDDWPMRDRVPSRHSYVAAEFPGSYRLAWRAQLGSTVRSQPVVSGSTVYINTMTRLHALGTKDGEKKWEFLPMQSRLADAHSANKGTPALHGERVFLTDFDGYIYSIDAMSGEEIWHTDKYRSSDESPCIAGNRLFVRYRGNPEIRDRDYGYVCLNIEGEEIWSFKSRADVISRQPAVSAGRLVFSDKSGYVYAINEQTGDLEWEQDLRATIRLSKGIPKRLAYGHGPIAIIQEKVIMFYASTTLISLNVLDGSLLWSHHSEEAMYAPASDQERLYYHWMGGVVPGTLLSISLENGELLSRKDIGLAYKDIRVTSGLVVGNHYLVPFNMSKLIVSFATDTGDELWRFEGGSGFSGEPVFAQGRLFVGDDRGTLYCFEPA